MASDETTRRTLSYIEGEISETHLRAFLSLKYPPEIVDGMVQDLSKVRAARAAHGNASEASVGSAIAGFVLLGLIAYGVYYFFIR